MKKIKIKLISYLKTIKMKIEIIIENDYIILIKKFIDKFVTSWSYKRPN